MTRLRDENRDFLGPIGCETHKEKRKLYPGDMKTGPQGGGGNIEENAPRSRAGKKPSSETPPIERDGLVPPPSPTVAPRGRSHTRRGDGGDGHTRGSQGYHCRTQAIDTWTVGAGERTRWVEIQECMRYVDAGCARCRDAEDACGLASGGIPGAPTPSRTNQLLKRRHSAPPTPALCCGNLENSQRRSRGTPLSGCAITLAYQRPPADASRESVQPPDLFHRAPCICRPREGVMAKKN